MCVYVYICYTQSVNWSLRALAMMCMSFKILFTEVQRTKLFYKDLFAKLFHKDLFTELFSHNGCITIIS